MTSREYNLLEKKVTDLASFFLDFDIKERIDFKDTQKYKSFVLLFHAALQVYWEKIACKIISEAEERWKNTCKLDRVYAALLISNFQRSRTELREKGILSVGKEEVFIGSLVNTLIEQNNMYPEIKELVDEELEKHKKIIHNNSGISKDHVFTMLIPLGITNDIFDEFEISLFSALGTITKSRNRFAHSSSSVKKHKDKEYFLAVISELKLFDQMLIEHGILSEK